MGLKVYVRQRVFVSITGGKQFCRNLHAHLHVALVISHHRSYCLAKENPLLVDNTLCFLTHLCSRCLAVQLRFKVAATPGPVFFPLSFRPMEMILPYILRKLWGRQGQYRRKLVIDK